MNKVMIIGGIGSGKSTLTEVLLGTNVAASKTQTLNYRDWIVDTPGEYTENPYFYKAIMATLLEVKKILLIQDATRMSPVFPPGFTSGLPQPTVGVITKADSEQADIERANKFLRLAMPNGEIIITSSVTGLGIAQLLQSLSDVIHQN